MYWIVRVQLRAVEETLKKITEKSRKNLSSSYFSALLALKDGVYQLLLGSRVCVCELCGSMWAERHLENNKLLNGVHREQLGERGERERVRSEQGMNR